MASSKKSSTGPAASPIEVRANGCLVWRATEEGAVEFLAAHRPRYDDWSWPKGKLVPGESDEECARRELAEETGVIGALGAELPSTTYVDQKGRHKLVRYWLVAANTATGIDDFEPNDEVDALEWMSPAQAAARLTYSRDAELIDPALSLITTTD